jgi:nucleotide-binding universal stress UspA family protein
MNRILVAVTRHVAQCATEAAVVARMTVLERVRPYGALVVRATECDADRTVMGRSDLRRPGQPHVGSQTEYLLEFTTIPVVVVAHSSETVV